MNIREQVELFAAEWQRLEGYQPAPFQKAIAMQRLQRGQSIREIIGALTAQRISPRYSEDAVNKAIASSNRAGQHIGGTEARAIHRLLKGRE